MVVERLPTPFAEPSWEPRFAVDGFVNDTLLMCALELHACCLRTPWLCRDEAAVFAGYRVDAQRLAVAAIDRHFPRPLTDDPAAILFERAPPKRAIEAIFAWLRDEAEYPPRPWFDGSEARGLQAFHVPYGQRNGPYGYLVIEPKWFEIHK